MAVAGSEAAARCMVKSTRGAILFIGETHLLVEDVETNLILTGNQNELNRIDFNQKGENPKCTRLGLGLTRLSHALPECRVGLGPAQRQAALAEAGW
jgi:hypothetical protein